jgi:YidC/Oxa1 family membrane protein insertase
MEKRVFLAIGLSVVVLIGFNIFFPPPKQPVKPPSAATASAGQTAPGAAPATELERPQAPAAAPAAPAAETLVGDSGEHLVVVENEAVRATFSTRGGVLTSWRVKH